jgi:hypothetical protein
MMADPTTHFEIIEESFGEAEREIGLMIEHGHTSDDTVLKAVLSMKLIAAEAKKKIAKLKGEVR